MDLLVTKAENGHTVTYALTLSVEHVMITPHVLPVVLTPQSTQKICVIACQAIIDKYTMKFATSALCHVACAVTCTTIYVLVAIPSIKSGY